MRWHRRVRSAWQRACSDRGPQAPLVAAPPVVVAPAQRVAAYQTGRYELVGQGTAAAPYYWVWIPAGATALPPPPPIPGRQSP